MSHKVAVLDIGSSKITVLIGERGVNNTINVVGRGESLYAGFSNGKWFDSSKLVQAIGHAIHTAQSSATVTINEINIGVPAEFCVTVCRDVEISLGKKRRITANDIRTLHQHGNDFDNRSDYELINIQQIHYILDDDRKDSTPIGALSSRLGGTISYTLCEKSFIDLLKGCMNELGISAFDFCSSILAESLFLISENTRDQTAVLIDVGHLTTAVAVVRGDGLAAQYSFSLGGGHISADLCDYLEVGFDVAEALKRKAILTLDVGEEEMTEVTVGEAKHAFPAGIVSAIVSERVKHIARTITKCLAGNPLPQFVPFYLTGGGLSYIRGAKNILGEALGRTVESIAPNNPQYYNPCLSSAIGLLDMVLCEQTPSKHSLWKRLLG